MHHRGTENTEKNNIFGFKTQSLVFRLLTKAVLCVLRVYSWLPALHPAGRVKARVQFDPVKLVCGASFYAFSFWVLYQHQAAD
jgi:hypothetical protein